MLSYTCLFTYLFIFFITLPFNSFLFLKNVFQNKSQTSSHSYVVQLDNIRVQCLLCRNLQCTSASCDKWMSLRSRLLTVMDGWYQWLNVHEFAQTQGDSEGQGSLVCFRVAKSWTWLNDQTTTTIGSLVLIGKMMSPWTLSLKLWRLTFWHKHIVIQRASSIQNSVGWSCLVLPRERGPDEPLGQPCHIQGFF